MTGLDGTFRVEISSSCSSRCRLETYSEGLEVIDGQVVAEQVKQSILEHAAVSVARLGGEKHLSVSGIRRAGKFCLFFPGFSSPS